MLPHNSPLGLKFHRAMLEMCRRSQREVRGYCPSGLLRMISTIGGVRAATAVIRSRNIPTGYERLYQADHLDCTVEALVQDPEWAPLFEKEDIDRAMQRLRDFVEPEFA